jgi:U3 small nucleolar RNA-associated protein 10
VFWRDDLLRQISSSLIAQVAVCVELGLSDHEVQLQECLSSLVDVTSDDALLKADNLALLMHTRAEDPRLRRYALQCSERVWRDHGSKLLGKSGSALVLR